MDSWHGRLYQSLGKSSPFRVKVNAAWYLTKVCLATVVWGGALFLSYSTLVIILFSVGASGWILLFEPHRPASLPLVVRMLIGVPQAVVFLFLLALFIVGILEFIGEIIDAVRNAMYR